jgi:hydrogenase expression/formation protein HypC
MPEPDDWVLVHVGFAMAKIDETEALLTLAAVKKLGDPYTSEIEAFDSSAIV